MAARSAIPSYAAHAMLTLEATQRLPETLWGGVNGMVAMAAMACGSKFNKLLDAGGVQNQMQSLGNTCKGMKLWNNTTATMKLRDWRPKLGR